MRHLRPAITALAEFDYKHTELADACGFALFQALRDGRISSNSEFADTVNRLLSELSQLDSVPDTSPFAWARMVVLQTDAYYGRTQRRTPRKNSSALLQSHDPAVYDLGRVNFYPHAKQDQFQQHEPSVCNHCRRSSVNTDCSPFHADDRQLKRIGEGERPQRKPPKEYDARDGESPRGRLSERDRYFKHEPEFATIGGMLGKGLTDFTQRRRFWPPEGTTDPS